MTQAVTGFGFKPYPAVFELCPYANFTATIRTADSSSFPGSAEVSITFSDSNSTVWPATVSGNEASWDIDKTQVAAMGPDSVLRAYVSYTDNSGAHVVWYMGDVIWTDLND